jgi:hypothetical protein
MGLVETIRTKPAVGATVGTVCLVVAVVIIYTTLAGSTSGFTPQKYAYFSDDDGKTYFTDDADKVPPYEKDGKQVVGAHVYKGSDGNLFVGYLERAPNDKAKALIEKARAEILENAKAGDTAPDSERLGIMTSNLEVKKPSDAKWVPATSRQAAAVYVVKNPDGSDATPVYP